MRFVGILVGAAIALFALTIFFGSWYTVDQGERAVILRNGAIVGVAEPGLSFKLPIIDTVVPINVQSKARHYENVLTYSRDQQTASLNVSVNYRLPADQVERIYAEFGGEDGILNRLLDRQVYEEVKVVFGRYNAVSAIQERERMVADMQMAVQRAV
jgi:regulator of protease activity HflC (stomatin/prohibitin superfamily)